MKSIKMKSIERLTWYVNMSFYVTPYKMFASNARILFTGLIYRLAPFSCT